jgi:small subunit ribosomal protein S21
MISVKVRKGEPIDRALKRFKNKIKEEGVLDAVRARRHFVPKSQVKRRAKQAAYYKELVRIYEDSPNK